MCVCDNFFWSGCVFASLLLVGEFRCSALLCVDQFVRNRVRFLFWSNTEPDMSSILEIAQRDEMKFSVAPWIARPTTHRTPVVNPQQTSQKLALPIVEQSPDFHPYSIRLGSHPRHRKALWPWRFSRTSLYGCASCPSEPTCLWCNPCTLCKLWARKGRSCCPRVFLRAKMQRQDESARIRSTQAPNTFSTLSCFDGV